MFLILIVDLDVLIEFFNQCSLQSDMVMEELKRVIGEYKIIVKECDELKVKLDEVDKKVKDVFDEVVGFKKECMIKEIFKEVEFDFLGVKVVNVDLKIDDVFFDFDVELS